MKGLRQILGGVFILVGGSLIVIGVMSGGGQWQLPVGFVLASVGAVSILSTFIVIENTSKGDPRTIPQTPPELTPKVPLAPDGSAFEGVVRSARNNNFMRGINEFGTELIVDVERDGGVVEGFVRQNLTPVQIACVLPGSRVRLLSAQSPGQYMLVLERW